MHEEKYDTENEDADGAAVEAGKIYLNRLYILPTMKVAKHQLQSTVLLLAV